MPSKCRVRRLTSGCRPADIDVSTSTAIARVDRMGQKRETEGELHPLLCRLYHMTDEMISVYCYYAEGTSIFHLRTMLLTGGI